MLNEERYVTTWEFDCPIGSDQYKERVRSIVEDNSFAACFSRYAPSFSAKTITVFGCISAQLKYFPTIFSEEILRKEIPEWIKFLGELGFEYPNLQFDFPKYGDDTFIAIQFDYGHMSRFSHDATKGEKTYLILLRFLWENFGIRFWTSRLQRFVKTKYTKVKAKLILLWAEEINYTAMFFWQKYTAKGVTLQIKDRRWICHEHGFYGPFGKSPVVNNSVSPDDLKTDLLNLARDSYHQYQLYSTLGRRLIGDSLKTMSTHMSYRSILKDVNQYFLKMEKTFDSQNEA